MKNHKILIIGAGPAGLETAYQLKNLGLTPIIIEKSDKIGGKSLYVKLKEQGVLIRHFDKERIKDFIRITIGSLTEMKIFVDKLKNILGELK